MTCSCHRCQQRVVDEPPPPRGTEESIQKEELPDYQSDTEADEPDDDKDIPDWDDEETL